MPLKMELWLQGLAQGRTMRLRALGGSMVPFLGNGDIVTIVPGNAARTGDIILTSTTTGWKLHRVVRKSLHGLVTKGDRLSQLDPVITPRNIMGRAVARERQGRRRSLVSFGARFCGLCFSLTFPWVDRFFPQGVTVLKRLFRGGLLSEPEYASISGQD